MQQIFRNEGLRNIAIIAHVDHGKTTLVDFMLRQSGLFRVGQEVEERMLDSMDLERERGITISAKNCSILWEGVKINIIDTPGHADFGGEVERALSMADGALLLVDAAEGPLPQTRYVLKKALELALPILVVINKIDRKDARPQEVLNDISDLFIDLDATDEQIEFLVFYAIARKGIAKRSLEEEPSDLRPLFEAIVKEIPGPRYDKDEPFRMLVSNISYSDYLGRLAIGRVYSGEVHKNTSLVCLTNEDTIVPLKVSHLQVYNGLLLDNVESVQPGDIIILAGVENVEIGDTICTKEAPKALKRIRVDEPTIAVSFVTNTSPFSGREGKYVQSRKIAERLHKEALHNVALRIEEGGDGESQTVKGRGELQMVILIETMRREGYELGVGGPRVIFRESGGKVLEPIEHLFVDCEERFLGVVTEKLSIRKGRMLNLVNHGTGRVRLEFSIPSRSLLGYRSEFLTDTRGTGLMNSYLEGHEEFRGEFVRRLTGSLVSDRQGEAAPYGLFHLEPRGQLFIGATEAVYEGMIVGEHNRDNDLDVNVCRTKKLSNMRASGKDEHIVLTPVQPMTIEKAIEFIRDDELVEITPKSIRLRKRILQANKR